MDIIKFFLNIILFSLVVVLGFMAYNLYMDNFAKPEELKVALPDSNSTRIIEASSDITQFENGMRFNHNNISYFINPECKEDRVSKMKKAFSIIHEETKIISFTEIETEAQADILVGCSQDSYQTEENTFVAGEGGPTKFLNLSYYPIILRGKILLYQESSCSNEITEIHELLHVFGFEHLNKSESVMYPYVNCDQKIDPGFIQSLIRLYSIEPLAELVFVNVTAVKTGVYLNFTSQVYNEGLLDAKNVSLVLSNNNKIIDSFELEDIEIGAGKTFYVNNLRLPSRDAKEIELKIIYLGKEFNKENNKAELSL